MHHITDAHEFHIMDIDGHAVSFPLPIILWTDNGLVTYLSSDFNQTVSSESNPTIGWISPGLKNITLEVEDDDGNVLRTKEQMQQAVDKGKYTPPASFAEFQERIGDSQVDDIDAFIKDMGRKQVKYGNVEYLLSDVTGEQDVQFKKVDGSARYSDESLKRQLGDIYDDGMTELTRDGLLSLIHI